MNRTGIIICSRLKSRRLPNKAIKLINGIPVIEHLVKRLLLTGIPIVIAIPPEEFSSYMFLDKYKGLSFFTGYGEDPLRRMQMAAQENDFDTVIRITHDKIFIDDDTLMKALAQFEKGNYDYLYSSYLTTGTGFEIINYDIIRNAAQKYRNVEHICYAIRSLTDNQINYNPGSEIISNLRLLLDYEKDFQFIQLLFSELGDYAKLDDIVEFISNNSWALEINKMPDITVYTCAYNAEKTIESTFASILANLGFSIMDPIYPNLDIEYLIIDDASTDNTFKKCMHFSLHNNFTRVIRNERNIGLASSSNIAIDNSLGRYVIRMDADDYFVSPSAIESIYDQAVANRFEVVYPDYFHGNVGTVKSGDIEHHVGGALFDKRALNHVRFTDTLRGFDGLDLFLRAKDKLRIGYLKTPIFLYTQNDASMSKTNLANRSKIKNDLINEYSKDSKISLH